MAKTREEKDEMQAKYEDWLKRAEAVILVEYTGIAMKSLDALRTRIRESGGEFHVVKNTLARRAFAARGVDLPKEFLLRSTGISFAFSDPASTAKALADASKGNEFVKVKGGVMGIQVLTAQQVKALAEMPPLPVLRAQFLGLLQAPAGKLLRTIAEPARGLAAVFRAYSEKAASPA